MFVKIGGNFKFFLKKAALAAEMRIVRDLLLVVHTQNSVTGSLTLLASVFLAQKIST